MRSIFMPLIIFLILAGFALPGKVQASALDNFALGLGVNRATSNEAEEEYTLSVKYRETHWEYGVDICKAADRGGEGVNKFGFIWGAWIDDFRRPDWQEYGVYAGAGVGTFVSQDELIDWGTGPFAVLGWDFSPQAGLEGKVGYFGENMYGTALFYWYF